MLLCRSPRRLLSVVSRSARDEQRHYDIAVIGSGGGAKLSTPSSRMGKKVALFETGPLGGTCLNRGCIPSKMLIHAADVAETVRNAHRFHVWASPEEFTRLVPRADMETLVTEVSDTIDEETNSINPSIAANENIDWYRHDPVRFVGPGRLQSGSTTVTADLIFVAAGARPAVPAIPGLQDVPYLTSTEALRLTTQPARLCVLGAGYIACEMAHYFGALGVEVTMVARSRLVRKVDAEVQREFDRAFSAKHRVLSGTSPRSVRFDGSLFHVEFPEEGGAGIRTESFEQLLVATGVTPNSDWLDAQAGGLKVNAGGFIEVDDRLRTNVEGVYALGDINGNWQFRHAVNFEAEYLMETVVHGAHSDPIDYTGMPYAMFTSPQLAGVGPTEEELVRQGVDFVKGVNPYSSSAMGMALKSSEGFVKLLVEAHTRKLLACHIVGHEASTLLHEVTPLMRLGGKLEDILYSIHAHPSLSELVRNAARKARDALVQRGEVDVPLRLRLK